MMPNGQAQIMDLCLLHKNYDPKAYTWMTPVVGSVLVELVFTVDG